MEDAANITMILDIVINFWLTNFCLTATKSKVRSIRFRNLRANIQASFHNKGAEVNESMVNNSFPAVTLLV